MHVPSAFVVAAAFGVAAGSASAQEFKSQDFKSEKLDFRVETVAEGLSFPWGLAFLPKGGFLVTERDGRMRVVAPDGRLGEPLSGLPKPSVAGQGGLLDVVLTPDFGETREVCWSYAEQGEGGKGTAVACGKLPNGAMTLNDVQVIFRQTPKSDGGSNHFGGRLVFAPDGKLFVTLGDRYTERAKAQRLDNDFGKVVRLERDGKPAAGNPLRGREDARPEIWSYGHRNPQAAAINPATGELWTVEHGARGGDEINIPRAGKNYGWPVISYGVDYSGAKIGEGTAKEGMEQPVYYWDPSIAPSGMAFYTADRFPAWKGDLFVGALAGSVLVRLELDGDKVVKEERLLEGLGERIRDVRQGPDGLIYILTDSPEGRILRLAPKTSS